MTVKYNIQIEDEIIQKTLTDTITKTPDRIIFNNIYLFINTITILDHNKVSHSFFKRFNEITIILIRSYAHESVKVTFGITESNRNTLMTVTMPIDIFSDRITPDEIRIKALYYIDKYKY